MPVVLNGDVVNKEMTKPNTVPSKHQVTVTSAVMMSILKAM